MLPLQPLRLFDLVRLVQNGAIITCQTNSQLTITTGKINSECSCYTMTDYFLGQWSQQLRRKQNTDVVAGQAMQKANVTLG